MRPTWWCTFTGLQGGQELTAARAQANGHRVSPLDIWISTPRPCPVMVWTPAQTEVFLTAGDTWAGSGFEFTTDTGDLLHPAAVTTAFEMIAYLAGLPPIRLHDLRHGAATLA